MTAAKHQLRDWIESQLGAIETAGDATGVSEKINAALERVSVRVSVRAAADDQNLLGSLGEVAMRWASGLLIVTTLSPLCFS